MRTLVGFAPALGLVLGLGLAIAPFGFPFFAALDILNGLTVSWLGAAYCGLGGLCILGVIGAYASDFGERRIGDDPPIFGRWSWFAIALCATFTVGLAFWGSAEPLHHFHRPPESLSIEPLSRRAETFAISATMLHWTLTPYAIFATVAIVSAVTYWRPEGGKFSLGPIFATAFGGNPVGSFARVVDALAATGVVFTLVAALAQGLTGLTAGVAGAFRVSITPELLLGASIALGVAFMISSITGLIHGIRFLSDFNGKLAVVFLLFVLVLGPTASIVEGALRGLVQYVITMPGRTFLFHFNSGDEWPYRWSARLMSNVYAWAPVTGLFLGYISRGRRVCDLIIVIGVFPALFSFGWIVTMGGAALWLDIGGNGALYEHMRTQGWMATLFATLRAMPIDLVTLFGFVTLLFLTLATVADTTVFALGRMIAPYESVGRVTRAGMVAAMGAALTFAAWLTAAYGLAERMQGLATLFGAFGAIVVLSALIALVRLIISNGAR